MESADHSSELDVFCTWLDVLQSSLTLTRNAQESNLAAGSETDYAGTWEDIGGRSCILDITAQPIEGYYTVDINWRAGAQYNIEWSYGGQYNETIGGIKCYQGTRTDYSPGVPSEEVYSGSGTAWLQLTNDGRLKWENLSDNLGEEFPDMTFMFQKPSS